MNYEKQTSPEDMAKLEALEERTRKIKEGFTEEELKNPVTKESYDNAIANIKDELFKTMENMPDLNEGAEGVKDMEENKEEAV